MSGLSISGTGLSLRIPLSGSTYGGGLTALPGLPMINTSSTANPASGLVLLGSGISQTGISTPPFTPTDLGASLLAWWDAEQPGTMVPGAVSSWKDVVGAYDVTQGTGAAQPIYSATSFNGRPGVTFDGTDDFLNLTPAPASFPLLAAAVEIWAVVNQAALAADATVRTISGYGAAGATARSIDRSVVSAVNRFRASVGDGAAKLATLSTVVFSGRHVVRGLYNGTTLFAECDGTVSAGTAVTGTTTNTRLRIGCQASTSGSAFWNGDINTLLFTGALTAPQATSLYAYLNARL